MHYYIEALKKYFVLKGRASLPEFWYFALFNFIIGLFLYILGKLIFKTNINLIYYIYCLAVLLPSIAINIRRLHDIGKSGWTLLFQLLPIIGPIIIIVLNLMESEPGDNKYGPGKDSTQKLEDKDAYRKKINQTMIYTAVIVVFFLSTILFTVFSFLKNQ
ncbi:MAG: DUF805 domain-containing protein [Candidatus Paceibacterota bacterium]|jgi:uncharacterized membrane protein YhaH (DUF805 family)